MTLFALGAKCGGRGASGLAARGRVRLGGEEAVLREQGGQRDAR